ncbi:MAG: DUF1217 domain-containing protein [Beijerinckiaceae bacterium]|nr:DUF1217 domain-containing protein [Beijerinckiaceae bacterium]
MPWSTGLRIMLTASLYFTTVTKDYSKSLAGAAAEAVAARETKYFLQHIGKVKTVDDLIKNNKLYSYVMKAFGLSDMMHAKGLIRKVLEGGVASPKSLANTLHDPRYKALAATFDFAARGADTTSSPSLQQITVNNYNEQSLEARAGRDNQGAQLALYFRRMAPKVTSAYGILGDKSLLKVVQIALGLPPSMSLLNIDIQAKMITGQLKIADVHDPGKLQKFIQRFTAVYDSQNTAAAPASPASALLVSPRGISSDLLVSLANLKLGGF